MKASKHIYAYMQRTDIKLIHSLKAFGLISTTKSSHHVFQRFCLLSKLHGLAATFGIPI